MARIVELDLESRAARELSLESFAADHGNPRLVYWIRVGDGEDDVLRELAPGLGLAPEELAYLLEENPLPGMVEREASLGLGLEFWAAAETTAEVFLSLAVVITWFGRFTCGHSSDRRNQRLHRT